MVLLLLEASQIPTAVIILTVHACRRGNRRTVSCVRKAEWRLCPHPVPSPPRRRGSAVLRTGVGRSTAPC